MPAPPPPRREHRIAGGAATAGEGGRGTRAPRAGDGDGDGKALPAWGTAVLLTPLLPRSGGLYGKARHPLLCGAASPPPSALGGHRPVNGELLIAAAALNTPLIDVATRSTRESPSPRREGALLLGRPSP